jgi:hypothetical protein
MHRAFRESAKGKRKLHKAYGAAVQGTGLGAGLAQGSIGSPHIGISSGDLSGTRRKIVRRNGHGISWVTTSGGSPRHLGQQRLAALSGSYPTKAGRRSAGSCRLPVRSALQFTAKQ